MALDNLLSPPILFFIMGVAAGLLRSDLAIPESVAKLLSLYLMWAIGIKGGVRLAETGLTGEAVAGLGGAIALSVLVPIGVWCVLRRRLDRDTAAALAGVYGSVSAVTFLTAAAFLTRQQVPFGGHMVAALALMESPAILMAIAFARRGNAARAPQGQASRLSLGESIREAALNGPVVLLTGSMAIGAVTGTAGHEALKPLYLDLFPGVLSFFLLELGLLTARRGRDLREMGLGMIAFGIVVPLVCAAAATGIAWALRLEAGNAFLLVVLAASASYIAAPAALRHSIPGASPGVYLPLALAVTFPFNITFGIPLYWAVVSGIWGAG